MADTDLRRLERVATINPADVETLSKLVNSRARTGEEIEIYWKIRHVNGTFCSGAFHTNYNTRQYFTDTGKTWYDKTDLYKFIKKAVESQNKQLNELLKDSEVVEYRTIEFEKTALVTMFKQAELI